MCLGTNHFPTDHWPELDVLPESPPDHMPCYPSLMGIFRWMIQLGRIDRSIEVSMLSSHIALSIEGHLKATLYMIL